MVLRVAQGAVDSRGDPVDVPLYRLFWGLQAVFANPLRALFAAVPAGPGQAAGTSALQVGADLKHGCRRGSPEL